MILLNTQEMRAFEALAREHPAVSERELIARAGLAAAQALAGRLGPLRGRQVSVLCGKGNNAADGLVLASHAATQGADVKALLAFPETDLGPEARAALQDARLAGVTVAQAHAVKEILQGADVVVDALVGTGARLPLRGTLAAVVEALEGHAGPVFALDLPSGLDADSGEAGEPCVKATWTISFLAAKIGLFLGDGPLHSGAVTVAGLDVDENLARARATLFDAATARRLRPLRPRDIHKKKAELLVVAGSKEYLGAALLSSRAAYRAGAGLVRLALPEALAPFAQIALPEAVVVGLPADGALGDMHLEALLGLSAQVTAAVVGPGLGRRPETLALVQELWNRLPMPAVFDADALSGLRADSAPAGERVLTPHEGEIRRLMGPEALSLGRVSGVRALAKAYASVSVLKGPSTLVCRPDGALSVDVEGGVVLATAGTGDVLAGAIGALLAQGLEPFHAAGLGVWIHGRAASDWAKAHGDRGMLASDLAEALPAAQDRIVRAPERH